MATRVVVIMALVALARVADAQSNEKLCRSATCFAEGGSECNRSTGSCPPCLYEIVGGYSCYSKESGACPFPDQLADCTIKPTTTPTVTPTPTPTLKPSPSPSPKTTEAIEQPATVTPPLIDRPTATASAAGSHTNSVQNHPKTSSAVSSAGNVAKATTKPPSSAAAVSSTADTKATVAPVAPMESASAMNKSQSSPWHLHIGVIIAAVAATAVIAVFVARRLKRQRELRFLETPEDSNKQFNLQVDGRTAPPNRGTDGAAGMLPPTVAVMSIRPARAISNSSDAPSLVSMTSLGSSTAEYGNQQQPPPPPYYSHSYGASSNNSSFRTSSNVSASSAAFVYSSNNGLSRPQLEPGADDGGAHLNMRQVHHPVYRPPVQLVASEDEYDIVRPGALQGVEHRSTETLVKDGRFQSNFSEADVRLVRGERSFFDSRELQR
ncbi:hypothetical protein PybrP1_010318 [[Pythium] brassicae (nom. inval.)]|nr:hypothetical protein PybrP1_010318 [[Pythium] brassicae (nom. inval.)]